jgi:hypothetical protein
MYGEKMERHINHNVANEKEPLFQGGVDLNFHGISIAIRSEHEFVLDNFKELEEQVTGMSCNNELDPLQQYDGLLTYVPSEDIDIQYLEKEKTLIIEGPIEIFGQGTALTYCAGYMAECMRSNNSHLMLIHSAAVSLPDRNYSFVFMGEKGAGKTTLALRLCHQYGFGLIGNDQIYLGLNAEDQLVTHGGNAWFDVRETATKMDPYLAKVARLGQSALKPSWNNKLRIKPEDISVYSLDIEQPIKSIFHIRVDHTQPDIYISEWKGIQRNLLLHERFGRHVTGQATPLMDDNGNLLGSLPPIDVNSSLRLRDELVGLVINKGITEIFAPDSNCMIEHILKESEK